MKTRWKREGGRNWDWQKRWRGRAERGVARRSEILGDGKSGRGGTAERGGKRVKAAESFLSLWLS